MKNKYILIMAYFHLCHFFNKEGDALRGSNPPVAQQGRFIKWKGRSVNNRGIKNEKYQKAEARLMVL